MPSQSARRSRNKVIFSDMSQFSEKSVSIFIISSFFPKSSAALAMAYPSISTSCPNFPAYSRCFCVDTGRLEVTKLAPSPASSSSPKLYGSKQFTFAILKKRPQSSFEFSRAEVAPAAPIFNALSKSMLSTAHENASDAFTRPIPGIIKAPEE